MHGGGFVRPSPENREKMTPVLRLGRSDWSHRSDYITWKSGLMGNVFSIIRPGARDSENSNLTLGDLASLFTQDDEQDEEQCMTGSYNFVDQSGPSTELQWKHKCIRSLGPFTAWSNNAKTVIVTQVFWRCLISRHHSLFDNHFYFYQF